MENNKLIPCKTVTALMRRQSEAWGSARYLELVRREMEHRQTCPICGGHVLIDEGLINQLWPGAVVSDTHRCQEAG